MIKKQKIQVPVEATANVTIVTSLVFVLPTAEERCEEVGIVRIEGCNVHT